MTMTTTEKVEEEEEEGFIAWEEEVISSEKGKRLVHYYFIHTFANSPILAVIGTERSPRHMSYVVADPFVDNYGHLCHVSYGTKWRARRELLDWLSLLVSPHHSRFETSAVDPIQPVHDRNSGSGAHLITHLPEMPPRKLRFEISDIAWNGVGWVCSKQLMHYCSFRRNGVDIKVHSFVFIMAEEGNHYVGYLEDMYEDKKTQKKVKVRWFHRAEDIIYQLNAHPREVFITPQVQVISADCIDGPASILTPEQYEQCVDVLPHSILCRVHMCFRQLKNNMITPFSISKLQGYFHQPVLACINHPLFSKNTTSAYCEDKLKYTTQGDIRQSHKRKRLNGKKDGDFIGRNHSMLDSYKNELCRSETSPGTKALPSYPKLKIKWSGRIPKHGKIERNQPELSAPYNINDEIELLCQDSGIRGCWFRCKVLQFSSKGLKIEYDDLQDAENADNLKEWVSSYKVAAPDKLGMRYTGRLTIRPRPPEDCDECIIKVGAPVEVWWHDGWWEGVVMATNVFGTDHLQIYLPGEDKYVSIEKSYVRSARDWVNGSWINAKIKPDILSCISPKANCTISDHNLPPISELVEVEVFSDEPSSVVPHDIDPTSTGREDVYDQVDRKAVELLGLEKDFGSDSQQYDAALKYVEVSVS